MQVSNVEYTKAKFDKHGKIDVLVFCLKPDMQLLSKISKPFSQMIWHDFSFQKRA